MSPAAPSGPVLAIDLGSKKTGFAVADALRITIEPLEVCRAPEDSEELLEHVAKLLKDRDVRIFVLGMPYHMDGSESARGGAVRAFAKRLLRRFPGSRIALHDERLSTAEADERLVESGYTGDARKARRDSWSAAVILGDWIAAGEPLDESS